MRAVSILDVVNLPKGKIGELMFTGQTARELPILPDGKPVTEFVIFEPGVNDTDYGPCVFDEIAAACVMSNDAEKANPLYGTAALDPDSADDERLRHLVIEDIRQDLEPRDRILARTAGLSPITDDNMGTEWQLSDRYRPTALSGRLH